MYLEVSSLSSQPSAQCPQGSGLARQSPQCNSQRWGGQPRGLGPAGLSPLLSLLACAPPPPAQAPFMDHCLGNRQSCPGAGSLCNITKVRSCPNELTGLSFSQNSCFLVTPIFQWSPAQCQACFSQHSARPWLGKRT